MSTYFNYLKTCKGKNEKDEVAIQPMVTWNGKASNTELEKFQKLIEEKYNVTFDSYWDLHQWSVKNYTAFWEELWHYIGVISSKPYDEVLIKTGTGFLDNHWFSGARMNFAENVLRIRDDRIALIYFDEFENEEIITFAEMFEEVKLYAAAFKKNGLRKGDKVACFMSNRKESVFAFLATTSIGAIWGGALPFYGARAASNIISTIDPKFLIAVDSHPDDGVTQRTLEYLPLIVENAPTLEKVILVVSEQETYQKDLSNIRNCVFLKDFLQEARNPDGSVPDLTFEQESFNYPIVVNFTSGTTGLPKGAIHSAGTFISHLRDFVFHLNLKSGDVICSCYPVGWSLWDLFVPGLALGATLFLYCGNPFYTVNGTNFLDMLAKYKVKYTLLITSMVDKFEKKEIVPGPGSNFDHLEFLGVGGSPVKKENIEYLQKILRKDIFIGSSYGATEVFGTFSAFNLNMQACAGEVQVPSLGMDIQCFDEQGKSVIGQRGELVVCTPAPNFPIGLWKDKHSERLNKIYLSKYPGVWCQNDECWINPKTRGIIVIGRSDDTLKQKGERFGAGDIYFAIHRLEELQDYICVGQQRYNGDSRAVLFVKMRNGYEFTPEFLTKIEQTIEEELWLDCVPELILEVPDIPYNINNKKMESVVRIIVQNNKIPEVMSIKNPNCLKHFLNIPEVINYNNM